jgi:predicted DNA-binding transcriptional regulator AlpA
MQLEDRFYTSTEVAEILGVSLRSVYRYLEENKLLADVKTATGRHRFTKQNILDFLYPGGMAASAARPAVDTTVEPVKVVEAEKVVEEVAAPQPQQPAEQSSDSEQVDWLSKFREAANSFKSSEEVAPAAPKESKEVEEPAAESKAEFHQEPSQEPKPETQEKPQEEIPAPPQQPKEQEQTVESLGDFTSAESSKEEAESPDSSLYYYRSLIGGLKDIAQNIDKSARKSSIDYAFTMNAGMSLLKPIKPFSLLHVYVRSQDKEFFEKVLRLTPSDEANAQLCLVVSDKRAVYETKEEVHGLYVVAMDQLRRDLASAGEDVLVSDLDTILSEKKSA